MNNLEKMIFYEFILVTTLKYHSEYYKAFEKLTESEIEEFCIIGTEIRWIKGNIPNNNINSKLKAFMIDYPEFVLDDTEALKDARRIIKEYKLKNK